MFMALIANVLVALLMSGVACLIQGGIAKLVDYSDLYAKIVYGKTFTRIQQDADSINPSPDECYSENVRWGIEQVQWGLDVTMWVTAILASLTTSIWICLYTASGFLLKAARRFDIGFEWFNRKFDIEKKPLQSIGLVAGVLVAVGYWAAVIVSRVVG